MVRRVLRAAGGNQKAAVKVVQIDPRWAEGGHKLVPIVSPQIKLFGIGEVNVQLSK